MRCDRCDRDAMILQRYSGLRLCGEHLVAALESRAKRTIRAHGWIRTGDRIAVGLSGSPASCSLLHFLGGNFGIRRDLSFVAITVDEGNGMDMDRIRQVAAKAGVGWESCSRSGVVRDVPVDDLANLAGRVGATKLALGTTLDARARQVFGKVIAGDGAGLLRGPDDGKGGVPRIEPFVRIPAGELALYARLNSLDTGGRKEASLPEPRDAEVTRILDEYTARHPSALFSLANLGDALAGMRETGPADGSATGWSLPREAACRPGAGGRSGRGNHG